jgi:hypothetical protein
MLVEMRASPYKVFRTEADIARAPSDALCIYQQIDGEGWFGGHGPRADQQAGYISATSAIHARSHLRSAAGPYIRVIDGRSFEQIQVCSSPHCGLLSGDARHWRRWLADVRFWEDLAV